MKKRTKIVVIGGNSAGPAAAAKAKRVDQDAEVIMFEAGEFISTGTCEIPYALSGEINDTYKLIFYNEDTFKAEKGVKVYTNNRVEQIDRKNKKIKVFDALRREEKFCDYDKIVLTAGSAPKTIPSLSEKASNVFHLKTITDLLTVQKYLSKKNVQNVLIIGSGYIGLECADAFRRLGKKVYLLEKTSQPMPGAEPEIQKLILQTLSENDILFFPDSSNPNFTFDENKLISLNYNSRVIDVDMVIVSIGFSPNATLAVDAGLTIGSKGGVKVNSRLRTSDPDIYAAGDNIEVKDFITNQTAVIPLANAAYQYGHIAGANAAGEDISVEPFVKNIAVRIFNKYYTSVGLTSLEAERKNIYFTSLTAAGDNLVKVMPGSEKVFGKVFFENSTKRILGASFYGGKETSGYADLIAALIRNKSNINSLEKINYNYTPPLSPFINLLSVLGKKIK